MLFSLGHGQHAVKDDVIAPPQDAKPVSEVVPGALETVAVVSARSARVMATTAEIAEAEDALMVSAEAPTVDGGKFRYYFPYAAALPETVDMPPRLDALADSMVEPGGPPDPTRNSQIPPVFTYLGQFIDHDITANTDRDSELSVIDGPIGPLDRAMVEQAIVNLRDGSLALDSLYGDAPGQGAFATKLASLMRFPNNRAKMRLARPAAIGGRVPLPASDNATDLLRVGFLLRNNLLTVSELKALTPAGLRNQFIDPATDEPILHRAIIGDARNDENLIVAQLQVLFLRLHNKLADATGGRSFEKARQLTRWHYQWLVVNSYLPTLCDAGVLAEVTGLEAPLYGGFFEAHGADGPRMPMPIEFSAAGFRFGHSMIRGGYDHNRFFGEAVPGTPGVLPFASLDLLFRFTGDGRMNGLSPEGQLPQNWVIEWERWMRLDPARPGRSAMKIDANLAQPLSLMVNQGNDPALGNRMNELLKHLARRNLRRGYRLNLPTAQGAIAALGTMGFAPFRVLTAAELAGGTPARQAAVQGGGFDVATPLWFYVLREAEVIGNGEKLGPLGTHIVAQTLLGLVINDPDSYWNADGGRWSPDKFRPADPIDSLEDVARFCGLL